MKNISTRLIMAGILAGGLITAVSLQAAILNLNFSSSGGTILDANGAGTGFTARMVDTGTNLPASDTNLVLNTGTGVLQMRTSAGADLNGGAGMSNATIVGVNLSSLGFSGPNDFSATATFINLTNFLLQPDQLCLVVGLGYQDLVRAGFINFSQFYPTNTDCNEGFGVITSGGADAFPRFFGTPVGSTMTVQIKRTSGTWSVTVDGIDRMPNTAIDGTGTPVSPGTILDGQPDLFVGVVAMDIFDDSPWYANLDSFVVTVSGTNAPNVATQPQKQLVNEGNPAAFSVLVADDAQPPISYQWFRNGNPIAGATSDTFAINPAVADAGNYTVVLSNSVGVVTSSVAPLCVVMPSGTFTTGFTSSGGGVLDTNGVGTGLARMPGTGGALPANDTNLFLNIASNTLEITTTSSDYNGGNGMEINESLGVMLSTLGFTGSEDLNVYALFPLPFPTTASFDQFGVVVGPGTNAHTRAGCITFAGKERYSDNVTNNGAAPFNNGGHYFGFGFNASIPMTVLISRTAGVWHHYIDSVPWDVFVQPTHLNSATDMFAGVFAKDVVNGTHKTVSVDSLTARVFSPPKLNVSAGGGNLTFTWNVAGCGLESNTNLANPAGWTAVPGSTNNPYVIPISTTGMNFYRIAP